MSITHRVFSLLACSALLMTVAACAGAEPEAAAPTAAQTPASAEPSETSSPVDGPPEGLEGEPLGEPETIETESGPVEVLHDFRWSSGGPDCIPGVYDITDDDVDKYFDVLMGVNELPIEITWAPGSGGAFTFEENGDFTMAAVLEGAVASEAGTGTISASGESTGNYRADPEINAMSLLGFSDVDITVTIAGVTMTSDDLGISSMGVDLAITYECYDTGLLSVYWPTNVDGVTPIIDMTKR